MTPVRVLLSARDPGSAAKARALLPTLLAEPRIALSVAASGPAFEMLDAAGARPIHFALPDGSLEVPPGEDPGNLLEAADGLLARVQPDVLIVGVSSLGVGLDEALLAAAGDRPTFGLQDYPGDASAIGGRFANTYFVRDESAARLTRRRFRVATVPVGSLKHAGYARLDVPQLRAETRDRLGASPGQPVLGFFAQPPSIPGHEAAFGHLAQALAAMAAKPLVLVREHPKFTGHRDQRLRGLLEAGLAVRDASDGAAAEPWLAACDVVTTCFSHCSMDYAFLSAWSPEPLGSVLFLLTSEDTRRFMSEQAGLRLPDGVAAGLGRVAGRPEDVGPLLERAFGDPERLAFHEASRRLPRRARPELIVEAVVAAGSRRRRSAGERS